MSKAETIVLLVILIMTGLVIGNMVFPQAVSKKAQAVRNGLDAAGA
jgi:hypothetical protein